MRKLLFNYSFYSHLEIGKFQGVTLCALSDGLRQFYGPSGKLPLVGSVLLGSIEGVFSIFLCLINHLQPNIL
jgi:hypothetical protein